MIGDWIFFGIGLVSGGIIGGCIAGKICAKDYQSRLEELQNERDQLVEERARNASRGLLERERGIVEAEKRLDKNLGTLKKKKPEKESPKTFEELSSAYRSDSENDIFIGDETNEDIDDDGDIEEDEPTVRILDEESFMNELNERDKETITFYQEDQVLTDAAQEVVHDKAELLGEEGLKLVEDTNEDVIYLDNEFDDILYEVIIEHDAGYYRDVLGVG